ncbi:MAG: MOSC domain-containing protein [Planctomycetaceae bacterium]
MREAPLEEMWAMAASAPTDLGTLRLIVRRPDVDAREVVDEARLDVDEGLVGDNWRARGNRHTPDGSADPEAQLTIMGAHAASAFAGPVDRWPQAGDQLYVDLDISETNLPAGSRLAIGQAEVTISAKPHTGCAKFSARFGKEALRLVSTQEGRALRLRGLNARVLVGGTIRTGDTITVLSRAEGGG